MTRLLIAAVVVISAFYFFRLDTAPIAVSNDESHFSSHALSLAQTGRDLNGRRLPVFVEMIDPLLPDNRSTAWWQPFLFYVMAIDLAALPFSEWAIRLPLALLGIFNVVMIYALAREMSLSVRAGLIAALLMALTPAHFIMSRQALDYVCPVPFALVWLWCLNRYLRSNRTRDLIGAGVALGAGTFSHISAWALMPMFAAMTIVALAMARRGPRAWLAFGAGILVPVSIAAVWLSMHAGVFGQVIGRYGVTGTAAAPKPETAISPAAMISLYWDYFSPSFLFFAGGSNPTQTTSRAGVFLLASAIFIPAGMIAAFRSRRPLDVMVLTGFLLAPLPVVFIMGVLSDYSIARAIMLVPFGVLLAIRGVDALWQRGRRARLLAGVALATAPLQFGMFAADYFSDYQLRVAPRLDALNTAGVAAAVIARDAIAPIPAVYLSDDLDSKAVRWRFHLWKAGQYGLWARTHYYAPELRSGIARGSVIVMFHHDRLADELMATGDYERAALITHPSGDAAATILLRAR